MSNLLRRSAVTAAVGIGFLGLAPAMAHADTSYRHVWSSSGPDGAKLHIRVAGTDDRGHVYYKDLYYTAGPNGATVRKTVTEAS
ncbi:hypothetical protein [Actinomadura macrotermitis]|uniref:Uncharacterized protein n=1 Tax=Actinomadura macrotermitis TaxID=2585200 RepID=A0A7K0BS14_9ACTN|nr:hypothetical protein [Actinomadura macrotermitis]MQY03672.1 hypothetical protein [Actinomadura macrotermitis]